MTYRTLSALVFALIVFVEIMAFTNQDTPYKQVENGQKKGFFSGYDTVIDKDARDASSQKHMVTIGATVLIGGIVTFAIPNSKIKK